MSENAKWLTNGSDLQSASGESLRKSLLTSDGCGAELKEKCLEELLRRQQKQFFAKSWDDDELLGPLIKEAYQNNE